MHGDLVYFSFHWGAKLLIPMLGQRCIVNDRPGAQRSRRRARNLPLDSPKKSPSSFIGKLSHTALSLFQKPKTLLSAIGFLVLVALFLYDLLTPSVFVEDVEIKGSANEKGFTAATLLASALDQMPQQSRRRIDFLRSPNKFMEPYYVASPGFETSYICEKTMPLFSTANEVFSSGLQRALASSTALDQTIVTSSSKGSFIRRLAFYVRSKLGRIPRRLTPVLYVHGDHLVLKVVPSPAVVAPLSRSFHDSEDAERVLSDLLIDFLSPTLRAAESFHHEQVDVIPLSISAEFLEDQQKYLFILLLYSNEMKTHHANYGLVNEALVNLNQKLLREMNFDLYGDAGPFLKLILSDRLAQAERWKQTQSGMIPDDRELFGRYILPLAKDLHRSVDGEIALAMFDLKYGLIQEFNGQLDQLVSRNLTGKTESGISNLELASFFIVGLIDTNNFEAAERLASPERVKQADLSSAQRKAALMFLSLRAVLDAHKGNLKGYIGLPKDRFSTYPCIEFMTITLLNMLSEDNPDLFRLIVETFPKLEAVGLSSFEFYNQWGIAETNGHNYDAAMQKFERALKFDGDNNWALLNWGHAAERKGDLELAREKYSQSLSKGPVLNAVYGLLSTAIKLNDGQAYLDTFEKYADMLQRSDYAHRSACQALASIFACQKGKKDLTNLIHNGEDLTYKGAKYRDTDLDTSTCDFSAAATRHKGVRHSLPTD
jgi:tetratricopeptide (TPR) repeat protein